MKQFLILLTFGLLSCSKAPSINSNNNKIESKSADSFAEFPGGQIELDKYIQNNWKWIEPADTVESFVYVGFIIRKDGTLTDLKIVKGNGCESCSAEAIRLVKNMPKWIPSLKNGVRVDQKYTLSILFQSSSIK